MAVMKNAADKEWCEPHTLKDEPAKIILPKSSTPEVIDSELKQNIYIKSQQMILVPNSEANNL